jgi:CheY-like chemotaxis protein
VPVRVEAIIQASLDLLAYGLESAGIRVHLQLASDLPETMADPDQLGQVFNNLVTNARQALVGWSGPRELWITSRLERDPDRIRLTVADSGPGVPDEARGRIFDPFFTTKPMEAGTGIGLALCRGVVEAHGGTIDLGDSEHGGATFVLSLPVVAAPTVSKSVETVGVDEPSGGRRVLIVDDEEEIRDMLADILLADGHQVEKVVNGREALELLTERSFDLIISDLIMPVLDGPGLYDALRRQNPDMANRLVFITGDTLGPTARRFLRQAGRPVIEKPFVPEEMRRAVAANVV